MSDSERKTIRGIVIPTEWNENGHPRSVAIATYQEQKYLVAEGPQCRQLLTLLHERVVVSGLIRQMEDNMVIDIGDFYLDSP
jgi:hypothetical protein